MWYHGIHQKGRVSCMKKLSVVCLSWALIVMAGCVHLKPRGAASISMTGASFVGTTNVTLKAGQSFTFSDPSGSGGPHRLSTGQDGNYAQENGAPAELSDPNGVDFTLGTDKTYVFATPGTYTITCLIHPSMNLVIQVVAGPGSSSH
jgi:plastocyanin